MLMDFLFDYAAPLHAPVILKLDPDLGGLDTVLVGKQLWKELLLNSSGVVACNSRLCLSLGSSTNPRQQLKAPTNRLICWAILHDELGITCIAIPASWPKIYSHLFPRMPMDDLYQSGALNLIVVKPVLLTEVILVTDSPATYTALCEQGTSFDSWFTESIILRQGDVHTLYDFVNGHHLVTVQAHCRVEMLKPVSQGYVEKGTTRFIVTLAEGNGMQKSDRHPDMLTDDWGGIEINENFLASTVLPAPLHNSGDTSMKLQHSSPHIGEAEKTFHCEPLSSPISLIDDYCTLYLKTSDLGQLGVLNSDWAIAIFSGSKFRLVRVVVNDNLVTRNGHLKVAPTLLFNMMSQFSLHESLFINLLPSPFGSHPPSIPTARTVTLARVASPLATNRQHQHAFLGALRAFFDASRRLVKHGDVIAVPIDTDCSRWIRESDEKTEPATVLDLESSDPIYLANMERTNEIVFFIVTNIEYDIPTRDTESVPQDMYSGSRMGELGCWVDASVTRMIQAGTEHSRIPDISTYFESGNLTNSSYKQILVDQRGSHGGVPYLLQKPSSHLLSWSSPFGRLFSLTSAALGKSAIDYELDLAFLLKGSRGVGKFTVASWVAQKLGIHLLEVSCYDLVGENNAQTEGTLRARFGQAINCSPCILVLRNLEALSQTTQGLETTKESFLSNVLEECIGKIQQSWKMTGYPVVLVGTTHEPKQVAASILCHFKHEVEFEVPGERERLEILGRLLEQSLLATDVSLSSLATQTAALVASDLVDLVTRAKAQSLNRVLKASDIKKAHIPPAGLALTASDFEDALSKAKGVYSEGIGAPKIPTISWDDVGGLAHIKADILDTIQLPLAHPELFAEGLKKRSGILLYGPPGTGKTLIAKAVATSCSLNFFSIKGPELLNMYIGESEANVRRVFQKARDAKPCVIFFDELDSIAPKRGNHGDSGGVMDRIVSQLLAELDGMSGGKGADVFVVGATNRPDLLDPALLRPGRFDRMLYLGVSETHAAQLNIIEALTRKFRLDPALELCDVANRCPLNYTGADFYALCSDAMLNAMSRKAMALETRITELNKAPGKVGHPYPLTPQYYLSELSSPQDILVTVTHEDFDLALKHLVPSVSQAEMEHYAHVQKRFSQ